MLIFGWLKVILAEKLWEGKGKTLAMSVKEVSLEGAHIEFTWTAKLTGAGKAKGYDVNITVTGSKTADFLGAGPTTGQGVFFTRDGDMVMVKSSGYGIPQKGKGKSVEVWSFIAAAQNLNWLNNIAAMVLITGDDQWKEFNIKVSEWNTQQE